MLSADSIPSFFTEIAPPRGAIGETRPYAVADDSVCTIVFMVCFLATLVVASLLRVGIAERIQHFFDAPSKRQRTIIPAAQTYGFRFLAVVMCLMYSFVYLFYFDERTEGLYISQRYLLLALLFAALVVFFLLKSTLMAAVNSVFFDGERRQQYAEESLFLLAMEGLVLVPIVCLVAEMGVSSSLYVTVITGVFIAFRLLTLYKQHAIFFHQKHMLLGYFIYLCTLEIAPFIAAWSMLSLISDRVVTIL